MQQVAFIQIPAWVASGAGTILGPITVSEPALRLVTLNSEPDQNVLIRKQNFLLSANFPGAIVIFQDQLSREDPWPTH